MLGTAGGSVGSKFKDSINPFILCIHCIAHRLALAAQDAVDSTNVTLSAFVAEFEEVLRDIHNHFGKSGKK